LSVCSDDLARGCLVLLGGPPLDQLATSAPADAQRLSHGLLHEGLPLLVQVGRLIAQPQGLMHTDLSMIHPLRLRCDV